LAFNRARLLRGKWRRIGAGVLLVVLAASEVGRAPFSLPALRTLIARRSASVVAGVRGSSSPAYWFDPGYAEFVAAVRDHTPGSATVALLAPRTIDLYVYCAVYELIPRRVVDRDSVSVADFVAIYQQPTPPGLGTGTAIPGGMLFRR
jgi:hypothetical protein